MAEAPLTRWAEASNTIALAPSRVRIYRDVLGLSLRQAAKQMGISFSTLTRFEHGTNSVQVANLTPILDWLDANRDAARRAALRTAGDAEVRAQVIAEMAREP